MQNIFKKYGSTIIVVFLSIILSYAYLSPLLEGKVLQQSDITHHRGMSKELADYRNETGKEAIWTNSMFGGMPGYMISLLYPNNLAKYVNRILQIFHHPASILILYFLGFYLLLFILKLNRWLCIVGAVAFGFSSYFLIILGAGHNTKAYAIGYMAPIIAGLLLTYRGKYLAGFILFTTALSLEILAGHFQITYYIFILVVIWAIVEVAYSIKENTIIQFVKKIGILLLGVFIAVGMNIAQLYPAYEYAKETIRGPSELTSNSVNKTSGLDKDYVVQWSQGIDETLTLLIPNFMGGGSATNPGIESESFKTMRQKGVQNVRQNIRGISMYRGEKPGTAGPWYFGAIVIFLFVLSLFIVEGKYKWWLLSATIFSIALAWGKNVMWLTSFLLDYLPMYNKFRAPETTLVIAAFTIPLLGIIGLNKVVNGEVEKKEFLNGVKWAFIVTGGITLLFAVLPGIAGDFSHSADASRYPEWLIDSVLADRKNLLRSDAFRSFILIALAAGILYLWQLKKIKTTMFIGVLGILVLVDLWTVDKRYFNNDNFVTRKVIENPFPETFADKEILKDKDLSYRVLPLKGDAFTDTRASYYHKNVGGYHAAKLRRYQELIEHHIFPEMQKLSSGLSKGGRIDSVFSALPILNMLNTKYIIYDLNRAPIHNPFVLGNAWFVDKAKIVENADEEIEALNGFDPESVAIIDQRFMGNIEGKNFVKDKAGSIILTEYQPNYLKYTSNAASEQLTVFSEIYYDKGWKAFIDGQETPHFRGDYVLRAMIVPEGEHTIEFRFEPRSYYLGNKISLASSIILLLLVLGFSFTEIKKYLAKGAIKE